MKTKPSVSIIIPTHNRSNLLQRAVNSALHQTYYNIEIIVVDDGSKDNTQTILKNNYTDPRLKILKNDTPKGACYTRNRGIQSANGEFITFLDDDDEFLPTRVEKMVAAWDDKWAYIATGIDYIKKRGKSKVIPPKIITVEDMLFQISTGNSILTKKSRIVTLKGFDESLLSSQDYDMWLRLNLKYGDAYCIQEPLLVMHTEHETPRITSSKNKVTGHFDFYKKHKQIMNKEQRKSKIFELLKYKNKKIRLFKLLKLSRNRAKSEIIKYYLKQKFPKLIKFLKNYK